MEGKREERDVAPHTVEPGKGEKPLVDEIALGREPVNRHNRRPRSVAVANHPRIGDAVAIVLQVPPMLREMHRLKRAVEANDFADAVFGLEPGKPTAALGADSNT